MEIANVGRGHGYLNWTHEFFLEIRNLSGYTNRQTNQCSFHASIFLSLYVQMQFANSTPQGNFDIDNTLM